MPSSDNHIIFVLNPGSTSTKLAVFEGDREMKKEVLRHAPGSGNGLRRVWDDYGERLATLQSWFAGAAVRPAAVAAIGGLLRPVESGTYHVNNRMVEDARKNLQGEHASNLGCALAYDLAREYGCSAFIVDPVSTDELEPLARYSGHPSIERKSLSHALNIHAAARRAAGELGRAYHSSSFIVGHLGGGISVAPVRNGKIVDVNDASSDGPFSPERTGGLPLQAVITLAFSGQATEKSMRAMVMGKGGLVAYLGTKSAEEIEAKILAGNPKAAEVLEAMAYQIAKEVGAMAAVLSGSLDAVVLTGGLASSTMLTGWITDRVKFLGRVLVYPGEHELLALAQGASRVLTGEEQAKEY
ncbi:MAG TPA: butyrate kinase [Bacteroidota bacterium]|nr:butyrate kinase [Bacteroidota bacterium]